jgi:hypothetical protein
VSAGAVSELPRFEVNIYRSVFSLQAVSLSEVCNPPVKKALMLSTFGSFEQAKYIYRTIHGASM